MDVLEKTEKLKRIIKKEIGGFDDEELFKLIRHIGTLVNTKNWKTRVRVLTKDELRLYDLLIKHGYHPGTVYKWFLLEKAPEELKQKIRDGLMGFNKAYGMKRKLMKYENVTKDQFIKRIIRCFELFYIEPKMENEILCGDV